MLQTFKGFLTQTFLGSCAAKCVQPGGDFGGKVGQWYANDSVSFNSEEYESHKAKATLSGLHWNATTFQVEQHDAPKHSLLTFPSPVDTGDDVNDRVVMEWYPAKELDGVSPVDGPAPAMLIIHEYAKKIVVGRMIAKELAAHGLHAFMVQLPHFGQRLSPKSYEADAALALKQGVMDARRGLDVIASLPDVDSTRISLQGISLGGFVASTVAGLDNKPHKLFVYMAGGNLASVLIKGKKDAQGFKRILNTAGLKDDVIEGALDAVEPLHLARRISSEKVWLYSGIRDDVVPPQCSKSLADAIGMDDRQHIKLNADHYSGFFQLPSVLGSIAKEASR